MASNNALVFASIFPQSTATHTTPTPQATPDLGFTASGQAFGGPFTGSQGQSKSPGIPQTWNPPPSSSQNDGLTVAQRAVKRNLAWSTATQFLSLQGAPVPAGQARHADKRQSGEVHEALSWSLLDEGDIGAKGRAGGKLLEWYFEEVKVHFRSTIRPQLDDEFARIVSLDPTCL